MRMILTDKEIAASEAVLRELAGLTFDEAEHALARARGKLDLAVGEEKIKLTFHPEGAGNPV